MGEILVDLKDMKRSAKSGGPEMAEYKEPEYPYGLCINLDTESLAKLGLEKLPEIGDYMVMIARVKVESVQESQKEGQPMHQNLGLQIIEMDIKKNDEKKVDATKKIYGDKY